MRQARRAGPWAGRTWPLYFSTGTYFCIFPLLEFFNFFIIICLRFVPDIFSRQSFAEFFGGDLYFFFFEDDFTVGVGTQNQFVGVFTELAHCG